MKTPRSQPIRLGIFEVDRTTGELRRHGMRVKLGPQSARLLLALLEQPGTIRSREELKHELWPAGVFVDFDHSLNKAMYALRAALGDVASNPRFIETVSGRGYRLLTHPGEEPRRKEENRRQWMEAPLVVLPFAMDGPETSLTALGIPIAVGVIDALSAVDSLRVIAFSRLQSAMRQENDPHTLGRKMGARAVLIGEVFQEADAFRVHVVVMSVHDGTQLWGTQFKSTATDAGLPAAEVIATEVARRLTLAFAHPAPTASVAGVRARA